MVTTFARWALALSLAGCNAELSGGDGDGGIHVGDDDMTTCTGLRCRVMKCDNGGSTTLTGTVNIPAGTLPLYGATVYVPNGPLAPIEHGATCDRCDAPLSGDPVAKTTTDVSGKFTLRDVPTGADIPLVIQAGKWRRRVVLPKVDACMTTAVPDLTTRLPKNQTEGDLPRIAVTTGGADAIECLLRKLGIDDVEFTPETGTGRVHLYNGEGGTNRYSGGLNNGANFTPAPTFWDVLDNLKRYDLIVHSCEGTETPTNKSAAAHQALLDYLNAGGRVFASHWHNNWVEHGPAPLPTVATFNHRADLASPITADIDMSFTKGMNFAQWMMNVGGSAQLGKVELRAAQNTVEAVNMSVAQRWISVPAEQNVQYLDFYTPIGAAPDNQCGRMVLTDIHVSSGDVSATDKPFPTGCTTMTLSAQEKALIFILFDLANCLDIGIG